MLSQSLSAYLFTAALLTVAPGPDTVMVLRAATGGGSRQGVATAFGIAIGCLCWGVLAAYGLQALMAAAPWAFDLLKWCGAAYLAWLGLKLLRHPRPSLVADGAARSEADPVWRAAASGLLTNLLNPKVGLFYLTLLPQFLPGPDQAHGTAALGLALIHVLIALAWFCVLAALTGALAPILRRPRVMGMMDRGTGLVLLGLGLRLALPAL